MPAPADFLQALGMAFTGYGKDRQQRFENDRTQQLDRMSGQLHTAQMDEYRAQSEQRRAATADKARRQQVISQFGKAAISGDADAIQQVIAVAPELAGTLTKEPPKGQYDSDRGVIVNLDGSVIRPQGLPPKPAPPVQNRFTSTNNIDPETGRAYVLNTTTGEQSLGTGVKPLGGGGGMGTAGIRKAIADNKTQLQTIDTALHELDANPQAVGLSRGTGLIPGLGEVAGQVNQRADPAGEKARNALQNATSISIVNRSGKAVTKTEMASLGFLPNVASTYEANRQKLLDLKQYVQGETGFLEAGLTTAAPPSPTGHAATPSPASPGRVPLATRVQQLKAQGMSREAARAQLQQEGYDLHGGD